MDVKDPRAVRRLAPGRIGKVCADRSNWEAEGSPLPRLEERGIEHRPKVNGPPQQDDPKQTREDELDDSHQESSLEQLSESWNDETAKRRQHVAA